MPYNERIKIINFYHFQTGHKNYLILYEKIINEIYFWNSLIDSWKDYIKKCPIYSPKNGNIFIPPPVNQISCDKPIELYVIELTIISKDLKDDSDPKNIFIIYIRAY